MIFIAENYNEIFNSPRIYYIITKTIHITMPYNYVQYVHILFYTRKSYKQNTLILKLLYLSLFYQNSSCLSRTHFIIFALYPSCILKLRLGAQVCYY